jgi:CHD5-like protein
MSLLWTIFFIEFACYLVLTIGSKPINELLWQLHCRTPFGTSKDFQDQVRLRREVVTLKREMAAISAQDEFTKWAKLRRKHDKALEDHDRKGRQTSTFFSNGLQVTNIGLAAAVKSSRSSFDAKATVIRWTCTRGLQFALQFYHTKTPIFTYPRGWFPWQIEYVLGLPRCPYGGVSINVWSNSCSIVIALVGELVMSAYRYIQEIRSRSVKQKVGMEAKTK